MKLQLACYMSRFRDIVLDFCSHSGTIEVNGIFVHGAHSIEKLCLKNSTATYFSRGVVSITLDNPQTSLSAVFLGTISSAQSNSREKVIAVRSVDHPE